MKKTLLFKFMAFNLFILMGIGMLNAQVIITQYYEGTSNNKYIEITNIGTTSVDLSTYYLARWSGTDAPDPASTYANGGALSGTIAAGQTLVYMNSQSVDPAYAVANSVGATTATYFNGDDPVALLEGGNTWADRVDCIYASITDGRWGEDISFIRKTDVVAGNTNMSVLDGTGEWTSVTLSDVAAAAATDNAYLGYYKESAPVAIDVTFNVDMNGVAGFTAGTDVVYIGGDFAGGWSEPGFDAAYEMTDTDGDLIYTITLSLDAGDIAYKFFINAGWSGGEWDGDPNRTASITETTTLDAIFGKYIYNVGTTETAPYFAGDDVNFIWGSMGVTDVKIEVWIPSNNAWEELFASTASDGTEPFTIPSDAEYSNEYAIRISDVTNAEAYGVSETFEIIATPSIYTIQSTTTDGDATEYVDQIVRISGIVTAVGGSNFWIQTPQVKLSAYPAWEGIFGYDGTVAGALAIGDNVTLVGKITEYGGATEITTVSSYTINSSGTMLSPVAITAADAVEPYESTLITILNAEVTTDPNSYGEFTINDGTADYVIDDKFYAYTPTIGQVLDITGVTSYAYGAFRLFPRDAADVSVVETGIDNLDAQGMEIYPNPSNGKFYLQLGSDYTSNTKVEVFNAVGMKVLETYANQLKTEIDLTNMQQGIYYVRVDDGQNVRTQKIMKQ